MKNADKNSSFSEHRNCRLNTVSLAIILVTTPTILLSQNANNDLEDEVFTLSPFTVEGTEDIGYRATSSLAGTRIATDLEDIGSAISVLTEEFLQDVGGVDNETALSYALGTEVAGPRGNFSGVNVASDQTESNIHEEGAFSDPNGRTRIRGLAAADNTRNFFRTDIPWDGYNVNRIDIQRGPNAMLFGLGSPAGVINATTRSAQLAETDGKVEIRNDQFGSWRVSADYNKVLIEDQLAFRLSVLRDDQNFRRTPSFDVDNRQYLAAKYKPSFLNPEGVRFELSASYERGEIDSNRPRTLAPYDYTTQFFLDADQGGNEEQTVNLGTVEGRAALSNGPNFGQLWEIGAMFSENGNLGVDSLVQRIGWRGTRTTTGATTNTPIWGDYRATTPMTRLQYASANPDTLTDDEKLWLELGLFAPNTFQNPDIFDFYNLQFDGPNKGEFRNWDAYDFELTNTYFNDKAGFNLSFHREDVDYGRYSWMNTLNHRIYIDMNETLRDFDIESGELVVSANPNVGRAYVQHTMGSSTWERFSDRSSVRFSAFAEFDMADKNEGWLGKLIGKHRLNYAYEDQEQKTDIRNQTPGGFGPDYYDRAAKGLNFAQFAGLATWRHYVSEDLRGIDSIDQINLTNVDTDLFAASAGPQTVRFFDTTWTGGNIYGDEWITPDGAVSTQNRNPANYAGWTTETFNFYNMTQPNVIVDGTGLTTRDYLTTDARLESSNVKSDVFVLQSYLWGDSVVGTYGYREDTDDTYLLRAGKITGLQSENTSPEVYAYGLDTGESLSSGGNNTNWSVAAHINRLLGDNDFLPFNLTFTYNEGENTNPGSVSRTDVFGNVLSKESGETRDIGVLISTKDNKYSLRVIDYETSFKYASTGSSLAAFQIQQALTFPAARREEIRQGIFLEDEYVANGGDLNYLYNTVVPAWDQFAQTLENDSRFDGLVENWFNDGTITNFTLPDVGVVGTTMSFRGTGTRDTVSTGTEFEFTANPVKNWRVMINAAKNKAVIDNAPGDALTTVLSYLDEQYLGTVGEMPHEANGASNVRDAVWLAYRGVFVPILAKNGKTTDEIRKWRYSVISNYSFSDGKLKGLGLGGAYRYQDPQILEYALRRDTDGFVVPDFDKPIMGPDQKTVDLWASYKMKLNDSIDWRIQLNLYNAFGKNEAIPINVDPDGTPNAIRIQEGTSWSLSNTFEF